MLIEFFIQFKCLAAKTLSFHLLGARCGNANAHRLHQSQRRPTSYIIEHRFCKCDRNYSEKKLLRVSFHFFEKQRFFTFGHFFRISFKLTTDSFVVVAVVVIVVVVELVIEIYGLAEKLDKT